MREKISLHQPVLSNFLNKEGRIEGEYETETQKTTPVLCQRSKDFHKKKIKS